MPARSLSIVALAVAVASATTTAQTGRVGPDLITPDMLREHLEFIASDELGGRATFSEGLGIAGAYIAQHLREWGVKPGGDAGSYFQRVAVRGVKTTHRSTVTVDVGGRTRTFKHGEGLEFPQQAGSNRVFTVTGVEFVGYGLTLPQIGHDDYRGRDVKDKAVVWLGAAGPKGVERQHRRAVSGRHRHATDRLLAVASIGPALPRSGSGSGGPGAPPAQTDRGTDADRPDFTTVRRLDRELPPTLTAGDEFFEFLFSKAPVRYAELKEKVGRQEPLPAFPLEGVTLTFNLDAEYRVVSTRFTRNVVGIVEGADPALADTFVAYGAHYDHVGYAEGEMSPEGASRQAGAPGRVRDGANEDRIWNGADDDGSGTVALMALARTFAQGTRPRRSILFIWHTGEERGLWGSRHFVEQASVPVSKIVTMLNADMVGRNRDDRPAEANTVYLVGSDRISTDLHNIAEDANAALVEPLELDYSMNDPDDLEQIYYRSDHYTYAVLDVPVIFFTTGLHADYHANTDEVGKIEYKKMARVAQLMYEIGRRVADEDAAPVKDHKGPRVGKGHKGKIDEK
jgi:hypothetical protein